MASSSPADPKPVSWGPRSAMPPPQLDPVPQAWPRGVGESAAATAAFLTTALLTLGRERSQDPGIWLLITHNVPAVVEFLLFISFMSILMGRWGRVHQADSGDGNMKEHSFAVVSCPRGSRAFQHLPAEGDRGPCSRPLELDAGSEGRALAGGPASQRTGQRAKAVSIQGAAPVGVGADPGTHMPRITQSPEEPPGLASRALTCLGQSRSAGPHRVHRDCRLEIHQIFLTRGPKFPFSSRPCKSCSRCCIGNSCLSVLGKPKFFCTTQAERFTADTPSPNVEGFSHPNHRAAPAGCPTASLTWVIRPETTSHLTGQGPRPARLSPCHTPVTRPGCPCASDPPARDRRFPRPPSQVPPIC